MAKNSENFSPQDAMRMAKSDAGRRLFSVLQQENGEAVSKAMEHAAAGDYEQVKQAMSSMLASPQVRELMEQLRRDANG